MKRRLFWLLAIGGAIWLYLRRGARRPEPVGHVPPAGDPADELRRKLDQTKDREAPVSYPAEPDPAPAEIVGVEQPDAAGEQPTEPMAPVVSEELDARRREIHERARSAADDMHRTSSD